MLQILNKYIVFIDFGFSSLLLQRLLEPSRPVYSYIVPYRYHSWPGGRGRHRELFSINPKSSQSFQSTQNGSSFKALQGRPSHLLLISDFTFCSLYFSLVSPFIYSCFQLKSFEKKTLLVSSLNLSSRCLQSMHACELTESGDWVIIIIFDNVQNANKPRKVEFQESCHKRRLHVFTCRFEFWSKRSYCFLRFLFWYQQ